MGIEQKRSTVRFAVKLFVTTIISLKNQTRFIWSTKSCISTQKSETINDNGFENVF